MKKVYFQFITDSRFDGNTSEKLKNKIGLLTDDLKKKTADAGLTLVANNPRLVVFSADVFQYRIDCNIQKEKWVTYRDIYRIVNSVQAVPFKIK